MQRAVREQEVKMGTPKRTQVCFEDRMEDEDAMSIDEMCEEDLISQGSRQRWALEPLEIEE
jgi:hypothetical protein